MAQVCYTVISSGQSYSNLFPCASFKQTDNWYGKASQRLAEQQQHSTLQTPSMDSVTTATVNSHLHMHCRASGELSVDVQCTALRPPTMFGNLTSAKFCCKKALRQIASQLKPSANSKSALLHPLCEDMTSHQMCFQDLLDSIPPNSVLEGCSALPMFNTSVMPITMPQVCSTYCQNCSASRAALPTYLPAGNGCMQLGSMLWQMKHP